VSNSASNGLLKQLAIADWPSGPAMELPLGRWGCPGFVDSAANGGISAAGAAVEQQVNKAATAAGEQLSGNPLLGPGQITATTGCDHKRIGRGYFRAG